MANISSKNRMSAKQLVISENAPLQFITNPKNGNVFFMCGKKAGYISPAAKKIIDTCSIDDLQYAECSIDGKEAVPCLMVVGNSKANVKRELGTDLLH